MVWSDSEIYEDLNTFWLPTKEKEINQVLDLLFEELVQTYTVHLTLFRCSEFPWVRGMIHLTEGTWKGKVCEMRSDSLGKVVPVSRSCAFCPFISWSHHTVVEVDLPAFLS